MFKDLQSAIDSTSERYANIHLGLVAERFANFYSDLVAEWSQENPEKVRALLDIFDSELVLNVPYIERFLLELNSQTVLKNRPFSYILDGERQFILPLDMTVDVDTEFGYYGQDKLDWAENRKMVVSITWVSSVGLGEVLDAFFNALMVRLHAQKNFISEVMAGRGEVEFVIDLHVTR